MTLIQNIAGCFGLVTAIASGAVGIDWKYIDTTEAAGSVTELRAELAEIRQAATSDSLEIRIEAARIKLKLLRDKEARGTLTPDERDDLEFTLKLIADLQAARLKK